MPISTLPDPAAAPAVASPFPSLRCGEQLLLLEPGIHALGGRAPDALPFAALDLEPRAATIAVGDHGACTLQRTTASVVVRVDGETVGVAPVELHAGASIEFGESRLTFEPAAAPSTGSRRITRELSTPPTDTDEMRVHAAEATAYPDAALVAVGSGTRHPLPARRIFIGRDESCEVIVRGNGVSRRHASVAPVAGGFMLRDESANGTLVNGARVVGTYLLGTGDVVRVQDEELRVELDASAPVPTIGGEQTTLMDLSHITRGVREEQARTAGHRPLTASLEIVRGQFAGACFQVERAVCSIGRGEENDVRLRDDSVSTSHATLLRKQGTWFVVDLRSMNGTYVDGSRVSGERELHAGSRVRVGGVELVFRAIDSDAATQPPAVEPTRPGLRNRIASLLRSVAPPSSGR